MPTARGVHADTAEQGPTPIGQNGTALRYPGQRIVPEESTRPRETFSEPL